MGFDNTTARGQNTPRFPGTTQHIESWFMRLNDPLSPRALWIKATVTMRPDGSPVAEAWANIFDGDATLAARATVALDEAQFEMEPNGLTIAVADLQMNVNEEQATTAGSVRCGESTIDWDLEMTRWPGPLGAPLSLLPTSRLIDAPFPKNKLLTPFPVAPFVGRIWWDDQEWVVDNWMGMQGHNWGAAHSPQYAWGQCVFLDQAGAPVALVEGASGRIELGPVASPFLSLLTVRTSGDEYRFDRIVDLWRQSPEADFPRWRLTMRGSAGRATVTMVANPERTVCLGYDNPDSRRRYCLNSKTAAVMLTVEPHDGDAFKYSSPHGGALEFLQPRPAPGVGPIV